MDISNNIHIYIRMIKFLKNQDIQVSSFAVAKEKLANNFLSDFLLANDDTEAFPLIIPTQQCNYNFNNSDNSGSFATVSTKCRAVDIDNSGFLASSPPSVSSNVPKFRQGKKYTSSVPFYTTENSEYNSAINPINDDGIYFGQLYNTVKNMYYNNYNNSYNMFGIDGYDNSMAKLNLSDRFITYNLAITQSGDKIRPFSLNIYNQTGDIVANILDDGNYNLYLSGTYFVDLFDRYTSTTNNVINNENYGFGLYLYNSGSRS